MWSRASCRSDLYRLEGTSIEEQVSPRGSELSGREREVLKLTAEGKSNKQMADYLHISVKTVEKHRANAMRKIGAKGVADVTAYAIRTGLVNV
jgi:DNA-binding CsgD family transcriptional regulator